MGLRRGFKAEAESTAIELRGELGLRKADPLDPWRLAQHLEIPVQSLSESGATAPFAAKFFAEEGESQFSAVTVFRGTARVIVHNDAHSRARQASNIAHELSHAILGHSPTQALDERGCRLWDPTIEEEASWQAGALLVPSPAAWLVVLRNYTLEEAADYYGVSEQMVRFRVNVTGAKRAGRS